MKTTQTTTTITCDLCGSVMEEHGVDQYKPTKVESIQLYIYYQGVKKLTDICKKCDAKIINFLYNNEMYFKK